ncbi:1,4-alpha-glucan branching protein GlgB [Flavobacterium sp. NST-5]|uniref:1,4-alpha-glucan branching enzyme GlgB n=1 Tax=Flavobacterium ichthyis TaxID=2698827 RepID=A0ABW9ZAD2_9FLAO|nr:1,4-alpha-glucan branching protein GlgB [Flavobacterium ichthyis]NBL65679.1 1,4-alpha-glucan branching protein GlgB [Flavobacterium ichthyis]
MQTIPFSLFTDFDINLFNSGKHFRLYEKFGAHIIEVANTLGVYFAVWAPSAKKVSVVGDFNYWNDEQNPLLVRWDNSGIWEGFVPNAKKGEKYKFKIFSNHNNYIVEKSDPYAIFCENAPGTASIIWDFPHQWTDDFWMQDRINRNNLNKPFSIYEVHLASWRKKVDENRSLTYREHAEELVNYVKKTGFTHVELMPIMEYPYEPSWGYQITGYFAPTSRFGNPEDFMALIDAFHQAEIGVILDWVPSHFPEDEHGLGYFDGSHLYEHPDRKKGYHPDWKSLIFNYGRNQVRSFLISNAAFWMEKYHIDALRVDAVASMLYLDYSREDGEWEPNIFGGRENLEAISFLQELNTELYQSFPGIQTIAEESTSFPMVSKPVFMGGLGFGMKWMMGWMHDTLQYFKKEGIHRKYHQNELTFSMTYAFTENFMLPLSHDEVVYGKKSIFGRMPGDEWQKFANLRLLYSYMFTHPGAKLLFMGSEFAQSAEWNFQQSLDWHLLSYDFHEGIQTLVTELNFLYQNEPAMYEKQFSHEGFEWINYQDHEHSVLAFIRKGNLPENNLVIVCNLTPMVRENYRIGFPSNGNWQLLFNSDASQFCGSEISQNKIKIEEIPWDGKYFSAALTLPALSLMVFKVKA